MFLSYRRADTDGHARLLYTQLGQWLDPEALFYDQSSIDSGAEFPQAIEQALTAARVVLVVIGPDWLEPLNQRVDAPGVDYVRRELELALARRAGEAAPLLLPLLMGGAAMPTAEQLHPTLRPRLAPLCHLNAVTFPGNHAQWTRQLEHLRDRVATAAGLVVRFRPPAGVERPFRTIGHAPSPHFHDPEGLLGRVREVLPARGSAALHGMGGVGKTQLALKYSHAFRDHYAGVWWLRAETETTLQLDAAEACARLHAPVGEGEPPSAALNRWLALQTGTWLLVYDNAEALEALRPHLPEGTPHHLLVTSRDLNWGGLFHKVELAVWTPPEGAAFLAERLPGPARGDLPGLAADLGGLPLALEQAAAYLEQTGMTVAAYRRELARLDTDGRLLDKGRAATGYERSVAATLDLAFERLTPAARHLLRLCAFAAPEPLAERLLREAAGELPAELAAVAVEELAWNDTVAELLRYGLARRVTLPAMDRNAGEAGEAALLLHRLTQQVTRGRRAEPAADCRVFQAVLLAGCPEEAELPAHWPRYAALAPHVTHLDRFFAVGWLDSRGHSWLLDQVASYLRDGAALYAEAVRWFERALAIDRDELGEEHPDTLCTRPK